MAVTWARKIWDGREGGGDLSGSITHTQLYRVRTDNKFDDQVTVLQAAALPFLGQPYPNDPSSYCNSLRARNEGASPYFWTVTATYSNEREASDSPLDDPIEYQWATEQFQEVADTDRNGQGIVNSAGDPFDPPIMRDNSRRTVTITSNEAFVPTWILSYQDAVNSDAINVDGLSVSAGQAKCQQVSVSPIRQRNDVTFRIVTLTIHLNNDGWGFKILDQGFRERDDDNKLQQITNEADGSEPTAPVLLDGSGKAQTDPTVASAVFLDYDIYPSLSFAALPGISG